ncbi:malonate--CoA ligase ACSF3, mitochondrial-like, partial [Saccoglossus kowalevskii]|uniref:Acyl-CoA synthetase family member 3, mitochondrial-like n=1 Tax=Saccoglossus kowalevskii TaxID=10224 RepID=A0ABM0LZD9_SACKO
AVGNPFPSVKLRIVEKDGTVVAQGDGMNGTITTNEMEESEGELHVKGPSVFHKYWRKPQATKEEFTEDGWFKTGDTVAYRDGRYHIIGRTSVDIIKSGGYKISALEIERHLLANQKIKECVVFGIPDPTWGENIVALVVLNDGYNLTLLELKQWAADILPSYKLPSVLKCVENIPKNPMGKVNKKQLKRDMFSDKLNVGL